MLMSLLVLTIFIAIKNNTVFTMESMNQVKKLLTLKQQIEQASERCLNFFHRVSNMKRPFTIKQLIETDKERDLTAELLEQSYDRVRKNELKFVPRNIVSDIENGIEITFDNVEYWNDIALSQLKPKERIHDKYRVGDWVSAFDYINDPYDILYLVNLDGVYQGGTVVLTAPGITRTRTTIVIHTFNMKVDRIVCNNLTSESYNYDALNIDEVLEGYWKSNPKHDRSAN
jgi:hypothetical protein